MSEEPNGVAPVVLALPLTFDAAVEEFADWLGKLGYATATLREKVRFARALANWMKARGLSVADLDERCVGAALKHRGASSGNRRRALLHFLEFLRDRRVVAALEMPDDRSPAAQLEERYARYLRDDRGLVEATVVNYRGFACRFLAERFGRRATDLTKLSPRHATDFLLRHLRTMSPKRAQLMGCALRSFLRFSFLKAMTTVDLSLGVPTVRQYRKASVPRYLAHEDVERVLATCDLATAVGQRDHAVLLLLARLALRASEVVKLELGDLRWRAGELVVRGKSEVHDRLPLPKEVGEALALFLSQTRAACSSRRVFLRLRAPVRGFASAAAVSTIVKRAIDRSGLRPPMRGAHLFRHSLATDMIQRGATMAEIGQVLRHRSVNTTEQYAKVDFEGLRGVSLPWLGIGGGR
jgi:site-specific recombinase XerD